jgi:hypothetical protein
MGIAPRGHGRRKRTTGTRRLVVYFRRAANLTAEGRSAMRQYEAVIEAMRQSGGYATLGQLYRSALKIPGCQWGTKTPYASIRRIVQVYDKHFFKIRPGLWALNSHRGEVLAKLALDNDAAPRHPIEFNHSYYQGLLVEIGNLKRYETFVPHQDKNRPFMSRRLAEIATLRQLPPFTHQRLLKRAGTVDVSWFNKRNLPHVFFEVEHSTDFRNSLQKFVEFRDFRIKFRVVADEARRGEFENRLADYQFTPVRAETTFISYDKLSRWYELTHELTALEELMSL